MLSETDSEKLQTYLDFTQAYMKQKQLKILIDSGQIFTIKISDLHDWPWPVQQAFFPFVSTQEQHAYIGM